MVESVTSPVSLTPRETAILRRAKWLLQSKAPNDPELLRRIFIQTAETRDYDIGPQTKVSIDPWTEEVHVTLTIISALDWDRLHQAGFIDRADHKGLRSRFRDSQRKTRRFRDLHTLVRALAVHLLSASGGGVRTYEQAQALYADIIDATPEPDRSFHRQVIREISKQYGTLN